MPYPTFCELGSEVLQVTRTPLDRARVYARKFELGFPYLCDPNYAVAEQYGLCVRLHNPLWYAAHMARSLTKPGPSDDPVPLNPNLGEFPALLSDDDMGLFVIDREGVVRHAFSGPYSQTGTPGTRKLPSNAEMETILRDCG